MCRDARSVRPSPSEVTAPSRLAVLQLQVVTRLANNGRTSGLRPEHSSAMAKSHLRRSQMTFLEKSNHFFIAV